MAEVITIIEVSVKALKAAVTLKVITVSIEVKVMVDITQHLYIKRSAIYITN
jgi:hypothetical protein